MAALGGAIAIVRGRRRESLAVCDGLLLACVSRRSSPMVVVRNVRQGG